MKRIRIYRHPDCSKCAGYARLHRAMDWLGRVETTDAAPPTGPLRLGQVVVEDLASGRVLHGVNAFKAICRQIPGYLPMYPLTWLPAVRRAIERDLAGADGESLPA